jgi:uncharacterized membrane protein YfcA
VVGATSLVGALGHWRAGNVNLRVALIFGGVAVAAAYAGARLAVFVSGTVQLTLLAIVMLVAAASMFRGGRAQTARVVARAASAGGEGMSLGLMFAVGLGVGLLTGLLGIGGGFLVVPALVVVGKVPMKQAIGTSLVVIAMNSLSGFLGYLGQVSIPCGFVALFTAVAIGGILAATWLVRFVSQAALKRAFAVFLVLMSGMMLYRNYAGRDSRRAGPGSDAASAWRSAPPRSGRGDRHSPIGSARYSTRNASVGSTRVARRAGIQVATNAARASSATIET